MSLPENILRAMHKRPVFAPYAPPPRPKPETETAAELTPPQERWQRGEEKKLSTLVIADLRRRGYIVVYSRTDRPTGQDRGVPDLIVMHGSGVVCVELKAAGGKLSAAQREYHDQLIRAGVRVTVAYNFDDAVKFVLLNLPITP